MITLDDPPINPLVIGDDYDITREVTGIPEDDTIEEAWLTIKLTEFDDDEDAIIQKNITSAPAIGVGQVLDIGDNSAKVGSILFQLTATDTGLLDSYTLYRYDIQVLTTAGKRSTREQGVLLPQGQITQA